MDFSNDGFFKHDEMGLGENRGKVDAAVFQRRPLLYSSVLAVRKRGSVVCRRRVKSGAIPRTRTEQGKLGKVLAEPASAFASRIPQETLGPPLLRRAIFQKNFALNPLYVHMFRNDFQSFS
jgi:hypothetical protein